MTWEVEFNERIWPMSSRKEAFDFVRENLESKTLHRVGLHYKTWDGSATDYARKRGGHIAATVYRVVRQIEEWEFSE